MGKTSKQQKDLPVMIRGEVSLPKHPYDADYEDYIAAYLLSAGYHVERQLILNVEGTDALEIDIVATDYRNGAKNVFEVKSGGWGIADIHKLVGWRTFCPLPSSIIFLEAGDKITPGTEKIAAMQSIGLIDDSDQMNPLGFMKLKYPPLISNYQQGNMAYFRYAFLIDRALEKEINQHKKKNPDHEGYKALRKYWLDVRSYSFFAPSPSHRSFRLIDAFRHNRNITARLANVGKDGILPDYNENLGIPDAVFRSLNYTPKDTNILYGSMMVEWANRVFILKATVDHMVERESMGQPARTFLEKLGEQLMNINLHGAVHELSTHTHLARYPHFWQVFIYQLGGYIIETYRDEEYELISRLTGIPVDEIDNAFNAIDFLFPLASGGSWFYTNAKSHIRMLHHFPVPIRGTGAYARYGLLCNGNRDTFRTKYELNDNWATGKDMLCWGRLSNKYIATIAKVLE